MNLSKFFIDVKGLAAVEFALLVPILLLLFLGGFETSRYVLVYQKVSKTAASMSDLTSRLDELSEAEISNSFNAVQHLLAPYYEDDRARVIITSVMFDGSDNVINWQRCGGGNFDVNSSIGEMGDDATLPDGFTLAANEDTIIAEVFYDYDPIVSDDIIGEQVIYVKRFTKPRLGALVTISDNSGETNCD